MENRNQQIYRVTLLGSIINAILLLLKFSAGIVGHSSAMIADAVHSLSDFITDIVVIVFVKISSKPIDKNHDYGHGKYETIATSFIGLALLAVAMILSYNGICKIYDFYKGEVLQSPGWIAFIAAIISIVSKEWIFKVTKKVAIEVDSKVLEANAWHHRSDALSSIGTSIGIGSAVILGDKWAVLDPITCIVVSLFIINTAVSLIRDAYGELLEESLPQETEDLICKIAYQDPMVEDIHNIHTRRIGNKIAIEMHLRLPGTITLVEAHNHTITIEENLKKEFGEQTHIMLHFEPIIEK